ncbi:MAG: electron transport complex subunit E [Firmicutes bacterium]|nr:electron transport complex subunit E [Bacillota bacterium]
MLKFWSDLLRGLWKENPTFRLLIGMCPTLAITTSATNGLAMGLATTFVLICSSAMISLLKNVIPSQVRIPCYTVIIATFVTVVDMVLAANAPEIHQVLGLFIPLIVVNCIILGRAEAYANKAPVHLAIADAAGMGIGFTWALTFLGSIREILGMGTIFGVSLFGSGFTPWLIFLMPPGGFLTLGILVGGMNQLTAYLEKRRTAAVKRQAVSGTTVAQ